MKKLLVSVLVALFSVSLLSHVHASHNKERFKHSKHYVGKKGKKGSRGAVGLPIGRVFVSNVGDLYITGQWEDVAAASPYPYNFVAPYGGNYSWRQFQGHVVNEPIKFFMRCIYPDYSFKDLTLEMNADQSGSGTNPTPYLGRVLLPKKNGKYNKGLYTLIVVQNIAPNQVFNTTTEASFPDYISLVRRNPGTTPNNDQELARCVFDEAFESRLMSLQNALVDDNKLPNPASFYTTPPMMQYVFPTASFPRNTYQWQFYVGDNGQIFIGKSE